jgi:hypothetical protein
MPRSKRGTKETTCVILISLSPSGRLSFPFNGPWTLLGNRQIDCSSWPLLLGTRMLCHGNDSRTGNVEAEPHYTRLGLSVSNCGTALLAVVSPHGLDIDQAATGSIYLGREGRGVSCTDVLGHAERFLSPDGAGESRTWISVVRQSRKRPSQSRELWELSR